MTENLRVHPDRGELDEVLDLVAREAGEYLRGLDERPVLSRGAREAA